MSELREFTEKLIRCPSITPEDALCQELIGCELQFLNFQIENLPFNRVKNLWAKHGNSNPLIVFVGHTDVVPPGPLEKWTRPPFEPYLKDGHLYGRGSADMKGSIAAMLIACKRFLNRYPHHPGSIGWIITSDEEGLSIDGTAKIVPLLKGRGEKIDYCIVGEPTCEQQFGDTVKVGRRGSLSGHLLVTGKQGHIAYPQLAKNPIHSAMAVLDKLIHTRWDKGNDFFQATSFQISNMHSGTGAGNVIPETLEVKFNFRYSPMQTADRLINKVTQILEKQDCVFEIKWQHSGDSFLSPSGKLHSIARETIIEITGVNPVFSTTGGTSDARFIAPLGCEIIEFGPKNSTIHQIDENVGLDELEKLAKVYELILEKLLLI